MPAILADAMPSNTPLVNPTGAFPFTVGLWVRPTAAVFTPIFTCANALGDFMDMFIGGTANQQFGMQSSSTGGANTQNTSIGNIVANSFTYMLCRWIDVNNIRIHIVNPAGTISSAQNTATITNAPSAFTQSQFGGNIGAGNFTGQVAEFFCTNTDIWPGGGVMDSAAIWQLAKYGPFQNNRIGDAVQYYIPFIQNFGADFPEPMENYSKQGLSPIWTNQAAAGFTGGSPPPILMPYKRPYDFIRSGMVG